MNYTAPTFALLSVVLALSSCSTWRDPCLTDTVTNVPRWLVIYGRKDRAKMRETFERHPANNGIVLKDHPQLCSFIAGAWQCRELENCDAAPPPKCATKGVPIPGTNVIGCLTERGTP